jgi:hypothetical protein
MSDYLAIARRALEGRGQPPPSATGTTRPSTSTVPGGFVLKSHAVELWTDGMGRTYLVADEDDRRRLIQQLGAGQGETVTVSELELIARITDPAIRQQVMKWKRSINAKVSNFKGLSQSATRGSDAI